MSAVTKTRTWDVVLAICAIASVAPLFAARHLPMSDLPEHVASMATIRHFGDPSWRASDHFVLAGALETPYWLYHALGALLAVPLGSAERANLLMLAIVGLGYPYALRSLLRALARDERLAIFGCALFWTTNLILGLLNFVAAVPLVMLGAALAIQQAESPSSKRGALLAVLGVAIFYLHLSAYALFLADAALVALVLPAPAPDRVLRDLASRALGLPRRLLWLAPSVAIAILVALAGRTVAHGDGPTMQWGSRLDLVRGLPGWLFDVFRTRLDEVVGYALVFVLLALVIFARAKSEDFAEAWRSRCAEALAATAFVVFLASPTKVGPHAFLLDIRMSVFVALFAIAVPKVKEGRTANVAFGAAAALTFALSFGTIREVRAFEREEVAGFDDLLRAMPRGKRLLMLNFSPSTSHVNANVTGYFGSYYRARYGGVASFSFSEMTHWPTRYRPGEAPPRALAWGNPCVYRNGRDGAYFDYVLSRGDTNPFANAVDGPSWELVGGSRAWRLYRKVVQGAVPTSSESAPSGPGSWDASPGPCT